MPNAVQPKLLLAALAVASTATLACGNSSPSKEATVPATVATDGGAGALGDATDPTNDCPGFVIDEGEFTVQPGQDINYCVRVPMPPEFRTRDLALYGWGWNLESTHHFFMEYSPHPFPGPGTDPVPCPSYKWNDATRGYDFVPDQQPEGTFSFIGSANNESSKIIFGAGQGKGHVMLDDQHGRYMQENGHFRTSHHLINLSDQPITTHARFKVCVKDAKDTAFVATSLVCTTTAIDVPGPVRSRRRAPRLPRPCPPDALHAAEVRRHPDAPGPPLREQGVGQPPDHRPRHAPSPQER
jgi:hypothetical protein